MQVNPVPCPQSAWFSLAHALKQGMGSIQKPLLPDPLFINVGNHIMCVATQVIPFGSVLVKCFFNTPESDACA